LRRRADLILEGMLGDAANDAKNDEEKKNQGGVGDGDDEGGGSDDAVDEDDEADEDDADDADDGDDGDDDDHDDDDDEDDAGSHPHPLMAGHALKSPMSAGECVCPRFLSHQRKHLPFV
jgi:hypothetical protein